MEDKIKEIGLKQLRKKLGSKYIIGKYITV